MNITIGVATHKDYKFPCDKMYLPIHVGRALNPHPGNKTDNGITSLAECTGDDTGSNISSKNKNYCELTALYWMWKNLKSDYTGLCHYRRYFCIKKGADVYANILTQSQVEKILCNYPVILPQKRNYFIETTYDQYVHAHHRQDLDITFDIIKEKYPDYVPAWHNVMNSKKGHRFNMLIMRNDILDQYCNWLFDILFRLEERLDISSYNRNDSRVFGFVSERILDVWLETNNIPYAELPVITTEKENWLKKGANFLKRKIKGNIRDISSGGK